MMLDELAVGDWYCYCCEADVTRIENAKELAEVKALIRRELVYGHRVGIGRTSDEAVKQINRRRGE